MTEVAMRPAELPWEREAREAAPPSILTQLADEDPGALPRRGTGQLRGPLPPAGRRPRLRPADQGGPLPRKPSSWCATSCPSRACSDTSAPTPASCTANVSTRTARSASATSRDSWPSWEPDEPQHVLDREPQRPEKGRGGRVGARGTDRRARPGARRLPGDLFEQEDEIGGCLVSKIPEWRLPRQVAERDLSIIAALEIDVRTGVRVGRDVGPGRTPRRPRRRPAPGRLQRRARTAARRRSSGLDRTIRDTVNVADPLTCETGIPGVFAGGDAVSGPSTVIHSLALGRRCAESAHRQLAGRDLREDRESPLPHRLLWTLEIDESRAPAPRTHTRHAPAVQRSADRGLRCAKGRRALPRL